MDGETLNNHQSHIEPGDINKRTLAYGLSFLRPVFATIITFFFTTLAVESGDWHLWADLVCSDCHTMHYSQQHDYEGILTGDGSPPNAEGGGPFQTLLLADTVNALCLICHDGTDTDAPDVINANPGYSAAGGFFGSTVGAGSNKAHNLGMEAKEMPPGGSDSLILSCTSCHNPHGSSSYRNLLSNPTGNGNSADVIVDADQMGKKADGPGGDKPEEVYVPSNIIYRSGMSEWCSDCHAEFYGTETGSEHPWLRHPQGVGMGGSVYVNEDHWDGSITNRVEVENPSNASVPSSDDEVFCLSCHKAHGSANKDSLIYADGTMRSTCLQCHYGPYDSTKHGDSGDGVSRTGVNGPKGDCSHCHDLHASRDESPTPGGPHNFALFRANNNNLCYNTGNTGCHGSPGVYNIYQGPDIYDASSHATSTDMYWPGINPPARQYGMCVNCHAPHGHEDVLGLIPSQAIAREEYLCEACHDGSPAKDIKSVMIPSNHSHPASNQDETLVHLPSESNSPGDYSDRHAECVDCHNPHYAYEDSATPLVPNASNRIRGVSGVDTDYQYITPNPGINYEYELCYKCHSSWTGTIQPGGQPDMAALFDLNNISYHPVEGPGKNAIDSGAFVNGWGSTDMIYCTDCHTSDDTSVRGPHGSQDKYILKNYDARAIQRTMSFDELCFDCHNYDTYVTDENNDQSFSCFDKHKTHAEKEYPCHFCHDPHGSSNPYLIESAWADDFGQGEEGKWGCDAPDGEFKCHGGDGWKYYTPGDGGD